MAPQSRPHVFDNPGCSACYSLRESVPEQSPSQGWGVYLGEGTVEWTNQYLNVMCSQKSITQKRLKKSLTQNQHQQQHQSVLTVLNPCPCPGNRRVPLWGIVLVSKEEVCFKMNSSIAPSFRCSAELWRKTLFFQWKEVLQIKSKFSLWEVLNCKYKVWFFFNLALKIQLLLLRCWGEKNNCKCVFKSIAFCLLQFYLLVSSAIFLFSLLKFSF